VSVKIYNKGGKGREKVFLEINDKGNIASVSTGSHMVPIGKGIQFYVDDYIIEQLHKCELNLKCLDFEIKVKEGEQIYVPEENNEYKKNKEIEELKRRLAKLEGSNKSEW